MNFDKFVKSATNIVKTFNYRKWLPFVVIIYLMYLILRCQFGLGKQRTWPVPKIVPHREFITFIADKNMTGDLFHTDLSNDPKFKDIFSSDAERALVKKEAIAFFKNQYGFSDWYLNLAMKKIRVNTEESNYRANYIQSDPRNQYQIRDGGYVVILPPGKRLYGRYGGKWGIPVAKQSIIPFGYYIFGNQYRFRYYAICPMASVSTYDGDYTIVDCNIDVVSHPVRNLIGATGKAQGMYRSNKLSDGRTNIVIRNILTLN